MNLDNKRLRLLAALALWLSLIGGGMATLWGYESTTGAAAAAPGRWPPDSRIKLASDRATLARVQGQCG